MESVLAGNQSGYRGGGLYLGGFSNIASTIGKSIFVNNSASDRGGGGYLDQPVEIEESTFQGNNTAGFGGGIYTGNSLTLDCSEVSNNLALSGSGVCFCAGLGSASTGSQITNSFLTGNSNTSGGPSLTISRGTVAIMHVTLIGGEPLSEGIEAYDGANVQIANTIITNHSTGLKAAGAAVTAAHTLFHGNQTDVSGNMTNLNPVYGDPLFADAANGDFHLSLGSPAIDAGTSTSVLDDFEGDLRPIITHSDICADEFGDSAIGVPGSLTTIGSGPILITIPPGALSRRTTILFLPRFPPTFIPPKSWLPVSPGFRLVANPLGDAPQAKDSSFLLPVEITITYTDEAMARIDESTLFLAVLDETKGVWVDATTTCTPVGSVMLAPLANRITVSTCSSGEFALLGSGLSQLLYLPPINR